MRHAIEEVLACAKQLGGAANTITVGDLLRFRLMAERAILKDDHVREVLTEIKNAFASGDSTRILFASHILSRSLHGQSLATEDLRWLFTGLVEVPQRTYSFGGQHYAFPRDDQYKMLAHANGLAVEGCFAGRVLYGEWVRACAAVYQATRSGELLFTLMSLFNSGLQERDVFRPDRRIALDTLAALEPSDSDDTDLKEALDALLLQQLPGSSNRRAVEDVLSKLAGEDERREGNELRTADNGRTWIRDKSIEELLLSACGVAEARLAGAYEASPSSHEERLTGTFLTALENEFNMISPQMEQWAIATFGGPATFRCGHVDVASRGPEKLWGADVGFYVHVNIKDQIRFERSVLVQVKKADSKGTRSWFIERRQLDVLLGRSPQSVYILYGTRDTSTVLVIPALTIVDIMKGMGKKARLPQRARGAGRPFRDFFTFDLIGDWWGDREGPALEVVKNGVEDFGVRWIFTLTLRVGFAG
jgi:hypothetical protein